MSVLLLVVPKIRNLGQTFPNFIKTINFDQKFRGFRPLARDRFFDMKRPRKWKSKKRWSRFVTFEIYNEMFHEYTALKSIFKTKRSLTFLKMALGTWARILHFINLKNLDKISKPGSILSVSMFKRWLPRNTTLHKNWKWKVKT